MALLDPYVGPWTQGEAAHLARRAGFGATPAELTTMVSAGMDAAVNALVDYTPTDAALDAQIAALPSTTDNDRIKNPQGLTQLQGWWIYRMRHTNQPLQEQFSLFLHDTLVSDISKTFGGVNGAVNYGNDGDGGSPTQVCTTGSLLRDANRQVQIVTRIMRDQNEIFRTTGAGSYRQMLISVTRDPAMLIYLDNAQNLKGRAQENYAREVMELFSMGVGNYSEDDVRENAKCFTGETLDITCASNFPYIRIFSALNHEPGTKTVFGTTVNFNNTGQETLDVIDLILNRVSNSGITPAHAVLPATSIYIAWKFITWFVLETTPIDHAAVVELATFLYNHSATHGYNYDVRETLRLLLKSQFFYDVANRYQMFKHPADFVVMALRTLELEESTYAGGGGAAGGVSVTGMNLFSPPNVAGWNHGRSWINSGNLIGRFNYANRLSGAQIMTDAYVDGLAFPDDASMIEYFRARLIQEPLRPEEVTVLTNFLSGVQASAGSATNKYRRKVRGLCHLMMTLPQYQLK